LIRADRPESLRRAVTRSLERGRHLLGSSASARARRTNAGPIRLHSQRGSRCRWRAVAIQHRRGSHLRPTLRLLRRVNVANAAA